MELHLSRHLLIGSLSLALLAGTASADSYAYNAYDPNTSNKNQYILDPSLKVPGSLISEAAAEVQEEIDLRRGEHVAECARAYSHRVESPEPVPSFPRKRQSL